MAQADAATLSTEERGRLPKSSFAYVDEKGEGHLPIHDAAHVKNALSRLNETEISESAKRKALRKIRRAAKKYGVEVNPDSDVVKKYGADESYELRLQKIREAFYDEFGYSDGDTPQYIQYTYETYVIFQRGDKIFRADFKQDGDEVEFDDPVEVEVVFRPVKAEGAKMGAEDKTIHMTQAEFDAAVEAKAGAKLAATAKDREAAVAVERVEQKRKEIAAEAVEEYKAKEKLVAERMTELDSIFAIVSNERADLEAKVRAADDAAYLQIKSDRALAALDAVRKDSVAAAIMEDTIPAPALRGGRPAGGRVAYTDPFRVTVKQ